MNQLSNLSPFNVWAFENVKCLQKEFLHSYSIEMLARICKWNASRINTIFNDCNASGAI